MFHKNYVHVKLLFHYSILNVKDTQSSYLVGLNNLHEHNKLEEFTNTGLKPLFI